MLAEVSSLLAFLPSFDSYISTRKIYQIFACESWRGRYAADWWKRPLTDPSIFKKRVR